jgi:N-acetyltransferase
MSSGSITMLTGSFVRLEPLSLDHVHQLVVAANEDRSKYAWTPVPDAAATMRTYVTGLLADAEAGRVEPFVQRRLSDQRVVGCTRFLDIRRWSGGEFPDEVEIGGTWLSVSAQRTAINTEAKYLLLAHAFETWGVQRLAFCTDERNVQSRAAIERIGASFEGILRNHRPSAAAGEVGYARQTAAYSILPEEWPAIKVTLRGRLYGEDL